LPVSELVSAGARTTSFWKWPGLGYHWGFGGQITYVAYYGPAVEVITTKGRQYLFSCEEPELLLQELERLGVDVEWPPEPNA